MAEEINIDWLYRDARGSIVRVKSIDRVAHWVIDNTVKSNHVWFSSVTTGQLRGFSEDTFRQDFERLNVEEWKAYNDRQLEGIIEAPTRST